MEKVLVPIDFSEDSINALSCAIDIEKKLGAEIKLLHIKETHLWESLLGMGSKAKMDEQIEKNVEELKSKFNRDLDITICEGTVYREIVKEVENSGSDLVLMGTHGHSGFQEFWLGGTAYKVVSSSPSPVITIRNDKKLNLRNIILPIDSTKNTRQKVRIAKDLAQKFNAQIYVVGICTTKENQFVFKVKRYMQQTTDYLADFGLNIKQDVLFGDNETNVTLDYANRINADLIAIMTEQETSPTNLFLGPYAQQMINRSPIPVLSVNPDPSLIGRLSY